MLGAQPRRAAWPRGGAVCVRGAWVLVCVCADSSARRPSPLGTPLRASARWLVWGCRVLGLPEGSGFLFVLLFVRAVWCAPPRAAQIDGEVAKMQRLVAALTASSGGLGAPAAGAGGGRERGPGVAPWPGDGWSDKQLAPGRGAAQGRGGRGPEAARAGGDRGVNGGQQRRRDPPPAASTDDTGAEGDPDEPPDLNWFRMVAARKVADEPVGAGAAARPGGASGTSAVHGVRLGRPRSQLGPASRADFAPSPPPPPPPSVATRSAHSS
jgi:hypothetical protein